MLLKVVVPFPDKQRLIDLNPLRLKIQAQPDNVVVSFVVFNIQCSSSDIHIVKEEMILNFQVRDIPFIKLEIETTTQMAQFLTSTYYLGILYNGKTIDFKRSEKNRESWWISWQPAELLRKLIKKHKDLDGNFNKDYMNLYSKSKPFKRMHAWLDPLRGPILIDFNGDIIMMEKENPYRNWKEIGNLAWAAKI